ncbi:MAG: Ig-like domain-containing protein [Gemmatimonadaceae bacterium]
MLALLIAAAACGSATDQTGAIGSIQVTPATLALTVGAARPLNATVFSKSGAVMGAARVHWAVQHPAIATVSEQGIVLAVAAGRTQVAASSGGKSAVVPVIVSALPPSLLRVQPSAASVAVGGRDTLLAEVIDASGRIINGYTVTWSSASPSIATVNPSGVVTGVAIGSAAITASAAGLSGTAVVTVRPTPVATVTVTPATAHVSTGKSRQLTATLRDASGNVLTGRSVTWTSSNLLVATVSSSGLVTGLLPGTVTIRATSEGKSGAATITVRSD